MVGLDPVGFADEMLRPLVVRAKDGQSAWMEASLVAWKMIRESTCSSLRPFWMSVMPLADAVQEGLVLDEAVLG